jgi:hypothetical protein
LKEAWSIIWNLCLENIWWKTKRYHLVILLQWNIGLGWVGVKQVQPVPLVIGWLGAVLWLESPYRMVLWAGKYDEFGVGGAGAYNTSRDKIRCVINEMRYLYLSIHIKKLEKY